MQSYEEILWGRRRRKKRKYTDEQIREVRKWKRELKQKGVTYVKIPRRRRRRYDVDPLTGIKVPVKRRKRKSPFDLF